MFVDLQSLQRENTPSVHNHTSGENTESTGSPTAVDDIYPVTDVPDELEDGVRMHHYVVDQPAVTPQQRCRNITKMSTGRKIRRTLGIGFTVFSIATIAILTMATLSKYYVLEAYHSDWEKKDIQ